MVVSIFLCPNNSIIVKKSTPAITKRVANVCLRSWKRKSSIPAYSRTVLKDFLISTYGALVLELINTYSDSLCIDCNTLYNSSDIGISRLSPVFVSKRCIFLISYFQVLKTYHKFFYRFLWH